ncbi:hypothetical protein ACV07N_10305 [Roseivirga echinicomitans]
MKTRILLSFLLAVFFLSSCGNNRLKYILAETVEIQYYDSIAKGEWISFDGQKWEHVTNYAEILEDTSAVNAEKYLFSLPATDQYVKLPGVEDRTFLDNYPPESIANELFLKLGQVKNEDGTPKYKMKGYVMELAIGKFRVSRQDGQEMKVMTSKGYGAQVKEVKQDQ